MEAHSLNLCLSLVVSISICIFVISIAILLIQTNREHERRRIIVDNTFKFYQEDNHYYKFMVVISDYGNSPYHLKVLGEWIKYEFKLEDKQIQLKPFIEVKAYTVHGTKQEKLFAGYEFIVTKEKFNSLFPDDSFHKTNFIEKDFSNICFYLQTFLNMKGIPNE